MFRKVNATLAVLNLVDEYQEKFKLHRLDDARLEFCMRKGSIDETLKNVIEKEEDRSRFKIAFNNPQIAPTAPFDNISTMEIPEKAEFEEPMQPTAISYDITTLNRTVPGVPDDSDEPEPSQIMKFTALSPGEPLKIECNEKKLKNILEKTGNRPVVVLAVTGPTRKGKSFFLNFVLRRLIGLRDEKVDWMGWTETSEPLVGFTWKANNDRVTDGIWMWSEPFTLTSKHDGSQFDLLLIDTQGVFDEETGKREWSILMGLSLLTSSCLVYNTTHNIDENDLLLLDEFLSFGEMALQDTNNSGKQKPFQNLLFLLRDWGNPSQYPYGSEGGQRFIQNKLQKKSSHQKESSDVRDKLEKCFNNISCILLPHPGPEVIKAEYDGSIESCVTFAGAIESAIEDILFKQNLPSKTINGNTLTGKELFKLFKTYVELFNEDRMLTSESMYYAACKACNAAVVSKCMTGFIKKVQEILEDAPVASEADLKEILKEEKERALCIFERGRKMGSRRIIDEADDSLCAEIRAEFDELKLNYMAKKEQNISNASSMAVLQYGASMEKTVNGKAFLSEDVLEKNSQSAQAVALTLFNSLLKLKKDDEIFTSERAHLSELLNTKLLEFQRMNGAKKAEAEEAMSTDVTNLSQMYAEKLDLKIGGRTLSDEKLEKYHINISESLTAEFKQTHAESPLLNNALGRLAAEMNEKLAKVRERFKFTIQENLVKAQELSSKSLACYIKKMTNKNANELDVNEFNTLHAVSNTAAVKILTEIQETIPKEIMLESLTALQSKISDAYVNMLISFNEKVAKAQADISAATKAAKKQYKERMKLTAGDHYVLTDSFLESQHNEAHTEALAFIEQAIQATQLTLKDEKKNKILNDYSDVISPWFANLRDANSKKMRAAEKQIEDEVRNGNNQYEVEKNTSINEVDVTDIDVDDFLDPIVEKIETKFNDTCHSNPLYSQGKQELVRLLKAEREKTKQEIEDAKVLFHKNSSAAVALAQQNYEVIMGEVDANINDSEFEDFHDQQLAHSIETLSKSEVLINSKWIQKYQEDLKFQINERFEKLFSDFKQKKIDFVKAIQEGKESAKGMYTQAVEIYFQESPEPFSEAQFQAQHNQEKKDARQHFLNCFQGQKSRLQNNIQEVETSVLVELGKEINSISDMFGKLNEARKLQVKNDLESKVIPQVEHVFTKLVLTALTSEADLVSAEQVNTCQPSVINSLAEEILSPFKSGSYAYELRLDFLEKVVAEKMKELQHSHNDVRVAINKNNELVDEAFSRYKNIINDRRPCFWL